jgi:hypothetical protein
MWTDRCSSWAGFDCRVAAESPAGCEVAASTVLAAKAVATAKTKPINAAKIRDCELVGIGTAMSSDSSLMTDAIRFSAARQKKYFTLGKRY